MVPSTRSSIADVYIVVLDVAADAVRALLFDSEARRMEGFSARLPRRANAAPDCLDEMHRLVRTAGFRVAAVVGRAESDVTAEDRKCWPEFQRATWFPSLPEGAGIILGSGCAGHRQLGLVIGEKSLLGMVVESRIAIDGLTCVAIDDKRWLLSGDVPEAGGAYAALRRELKGKGSLEGYLERAAADDPRLAGLNLVEQRFREVFEQLKLAGKESVEVIACGTTLLKSPAWTLRIANALGVPLTMCTEPEPTARGAALWALERTGAISHLEALPPSNECVVRPVTASA